MLYLKEKLSFKIIRYIIVWIIGGVILIGGFDYLKWRSFQDDFSVSTSGIQYRNYDEYIWPKFLTTEEDVITQYFSPIKNGLSEIRIRLAYNHTTLLETYGASICIILMDEKKNILIKEEISSDSISNWRYYILKTENLKKGSMYSISLMQTNGAKNESGEYQLSYVPFIYDRQIIEDIPAENRYCEYNGEKQDYEWDLYYVYQYINKNNIQQLFIINIIAAICLILFAILFWYNKRKAILLVSLCLAGIFLYRGIQIYRENKLWYHQNIYIAHAMGGIDGIGYTNSLEAFETAYQNGLRVFEVDFSMTSDNKIVLKHDWENLSGMIGYESGYIPTLEEYKSIKLYEKYTTLDIYDLFELMLKYRDIYIVTDSKLAAYEEVVEQFNLLSSILKNHNLSDQKHILEHSIIQLYNDNMLNAVESVIHFDNYIYTLYQRGLDDIEILADFCVKNKIPVITMPYSWWTEEVNNLLHKKGLKVFLHTLNDSKEVQDYLNSGVDGIYTDFITVSD